jgi:hypothetical protein
MNTCRLLLIAGMAIVLAAGVTENVVAGSVERASGMTLAAKKKAAPAAQNRIPSQIACTVAGCHPIPPGCRPEAGYNWDGIPTGFDIVVCPPLREAAWLNART